MSVRLLEPDELPDVLDEAEAFYNEHYQEDGPFNREHFLQFWSTAMQWGQALIFVEEQDGVSRGTFGCMRGENCYSGSREYMGFFTAVKPEHRGGTVVLELMEGALAFLKKFNEPFTIKLTSRVPTLQAIWGRLGFEEDAIRYQRKVIL